MDKNYNVDDILSEIKNRKSRQRSNPVQEPVAEKPPVRDALASAGTDKPARPEPPELFDIPAPQDEREFHFDAAPAPDRRAQNPMSFTGHVRPLTDKAKMRPGILGQQQPTQKPGQSRFDFFEPEPVVKAIPHPDVPDAPDRIKNERKPDAPFFEFFEPEQAEPPPVAPAPPAQTAVPQSDFSAFSPPDLGHTREHTRVLPQVAPDEPASKSDAGYYEADDYPHDNMSDHSAVDFSEYNSLADRRDVATDIARVKLWLFIRLAATALLTAVLLYLSMSGRYVMPLPSSIEPVGETIRAYLITCTSITALAALINSSTIGGGLISLFKMRAGSDTVVTLALLAAIGQGVAASVKPGAVDPIDLSLYFPIAALAMLFNVIGKMRMIGRIQQNFRVVATDKKKKALLRVEDDAFCREFVPEATVRRPTIAYSVGADFFTDFLGLSYSDKYDVGINRVVAPVCLACSIAGGVICYLLTENSMSAISALTAILCVCATLSTTFIENVPLAKLAAKLTPMGGMVSGNKAVEDFCDASAVIMTENDLFPDGNIRLRGIKTFSQGRIDESILDAASVICSQGCALSPVFMQMIGGDKRLLRKVDNIVYENGMGISAWVASRRVLIGNRLLMQNHGVYLPPETASGHSRLPEDGELVYLASSGEATAQFTVSYHIDDELAAELDQLAAHDKLLIVYTTDANITPHRIWELYGYPEELVRILPAERHAAYRDITAHREKVIAEVVYTGRASTLAAAITACINARSSILSATLLQLIQMVLGYGLVAFMAFMGAIGSLTVIQILIYQAFWFVIIFIVQKSKQA